MMLCADADADGWMNDWALDPFAELVQSLSSKTVCYPSTHGTKRVFCHMTLTGLQGHEGETREGCDQ